MKEVLTIAFLYAMNQPQDLIQAIVLSCGNRQLRDKWEFIFRVAMLRFILILAYGYILPKIGLLPATFPTQMFSGMIGMSMLITGIHGTAVPFTMDFNNLREIEDRLMAPVSIKIVALAKNVSWYYRIFYRWIDCVTYFTHSYGKFT